CLLSNQHEGVGASRRIQTGTTTLVERVVVWESPTTLSYDIEGLPPVVRSATNTWSVAASDGGTRVELTSSVDAGPRPPQKAIAKLVARKMGQASDLMLAGLAGRLS
ncbi:MAG: SRPBCC family protein, partial [Actinomycetota bacterium]|nr:SRPBCC family protein [Actinomycetota bacterium]